MHQLEVTEMGIPVRAVGTLCSTTNLIGPLVELIKDEVEVIKDEFTTDPSEASYRQVSRKMLVLV